MERIHTERAPKAIGPYSQAIKSGRHVFCSGQIAIDPISNEFKPGTIAEETERVIQNLKAVLEAANTSIDKAVKVTVYLSSIDDFAAMNEVYGEHFLHNPSRSTVGVSRLPKDAKIEIDVIAECS